MITLVIIGVIAAITVPTLITKYQKEQTVTRLKKAYSALAQTTNRAIADNGPIENWQYASEQESLKFAQTYLFPYMNISNKCINSSGGITTTGNCSFNYYFLNPNSSKQELNNSQPRFILNDGTKIGLHCTISSTSSAHICLVYVDINGNKKPNRMGKDVFRFVYWVTPGTTTESQNNLGKFLPTDSNRERKYLISSNNGGGCNKNSQTVSGVTCAALIMTDGWQIKDDYPW